MAFRGMMGPKCGCNDGIRIIYTGKGRIEHTCWCPRGCEREHEKLKADLLAAYNAILNGEKS